MVHVGCLAERIGKRKEPGSCEEEIPLHQQFMKVEKVPSELEGEIVLIN